MRALLLVVVVCASIALCAADPADVSESGDWQGTSPDGKHFASLAIKRDEQMIWRKDLGTGLLEVYEPSRPGGKFTDGPDSAALGRYACFEISDRLGLQAQWSPDSRYLVVTTASLGGHSAWHFDAFVYCADDRTVRSMDDVVGPVVSPSFKFTGPHTVKLGLAVPGPNGFYLEHPKEVEIDLDQKSALMEKQKVIAHGSLSDD
jgi:hypothetical protein